MKAAPTGTVARALLHVVMLVIRAVASDLRRGRQPLAPAHMGSLMRIASGPCTMSELARHQAVGLPTMSKSIDMLVRHGWVERSVNASDRRQALVGLTASGRRLLTDMTRRTERHVARSLAPLTRAERAVLTTVMTRLSDVLDEAGSLRCAAPAPLKTRPPVRSRQSLRMSKVSPVKRAVGAQQEGVG